MQKQEDQKIGDMEIIDGLTVYPSLEEAEEWGAVEDIASLVEDEDEAIKDDEAAKGDSHE